MDSLILQIAARHLLPIFVIYSIIILFRGHNAPGGGFVAGLLIAAGFIVYAIAYGVDRVRSKIRFDPRTFIGIGLLLALLSGLPSLVKTKPFTTIEFGEWKIPLLGKIALSTPLIFDLGVYLVVSGVLLMIILTLSEEK
ncbi:MAG: Na+/H+ antiporter subunit B [candidate division KSB1 bacterium]|nr:Na+/H+ antiporter subunit B [candidate division KSB1 bacterium]MDZ7318981.1 Na+/H+ antiporter subunit B [candidate division KSB1 bacterium]MDZ7340981.1 Na+/H+ antiporter subunit B [candidate division KSB1 bacterium]